MTCPTTNSPRITRLVPRRLRRGLAASWLLIWSPVFLAALLLVVEIGHLWWAQVQLENALEAAALAGVDAWRDTSDTDLARAYAVTYAAANEVGANPAKAVTLSPNGGGVGANGNFSCDGDIILGIVTRPQNTPDIDCTEFIFNADDAPVSGGTGIYVSLTARVFTMSDTMGDVQTNSNGTGNYPFQVFDFYSNKPNLQIASVTFNVASVPPHDPEPGFFDLRIPPQPNATGADKNNGIQPIFNGTGVGDVLGTDFTATPSFGTVDITSASYRISFLTTSVDPFKPGPYLQPDSNPNNWSPNTMDPAAGERFEFGVDTDNVGIDPGNKPAQAVDRGGDFNGATVVVSFRLDGDIVGVISGQLAKTSDHESIVTFDVVELTSGALGIRVKRQSLSIAPLCTSLFGFNLGTFSISAEAAAMVEGTDSPHLIRIKQFNCN